MFTMNKRNAFLIIKYLDQNQAYTYFMYFVFDVEFAFQKVYYSLLSIDYVSSIINQLSIHRIKFCCPST